MAKRELRLRMRREPDPVLVRDELDWLLGVALDRVDMHTRSMERQKVSESVIRSRMTGKAVIRKLRRAGAVDPQLRTAEDREANRARRD